MIPERAGHILLVEDDDDHAEIVARGLAASGMDYRLRRLADGETALHYLFREGPYTDPETSPRPSVILLDLRLPRVDGCEVLQAIKNDPAVRGIPVVILTTSAAERDIASGYRNHVNSYLVKPLDFGEFAKLMETLCLYWLTLNQKAPESSQETR